MEQFYLCICTKSILVRGVPFRNGISAPVGACEGVPAAPFGRDPLHRVDLVGDPPDRQRLETGLLDDALRRLEQCRGSPLIVFPGSSHLDDYNVSLLRYRVPK